nr:MAG TPA: hypothetical protein [Caudoviricetes sp.]
MRIHAYTVGWWQAGGIVTTPLFSLFNFALN